MEQLKIIDGKSVEGLECRALDIDSIYSKLVKLLYNGERIAVQPNSVNKWMKKGAVVIC